MPQGAGGIEMTDITERLRRLYVQHGTDYVQAAADEIERLRAELADISQAAHSVLHVLDTRFDSPSLQGATDELRRAIARK